MFHSYTRRDGPHDTLIQGIVFDYENDVQGYHQRFVHAWGMVSKFDSKTLGKNNSIPLELYIRWVRSRAQNPMIPYLVVLLVIIEPIVEGDISRTILYPNMPTDFEELHKSWIQLKE